MKPEIMKKFKAMFESQKKSLLYSGKLVNASFELPKDDMLDDVAQGLGREIGGSGGGCGHEVLFPV